MTTKLKELIDVSGTADWRRRKAEEFPDDSRNVEAYLLLDKLGGELPSLDGGDIHKRLERRREIDGLAFGEVVTEELRKIGFDSWPASGRILLEGIADRLEH
jgi:hypothetical protein